MRLIAALLIATAAHPTLAAQTVSPNAPEPNQVPADVRGFRELTPGTTLTPPPGFSPARDFHGYRNPGRNAWIEVNEIAIPLAGVLPDFERVAMANRRQYQLETSRVRVSDRRGVLIRAVERERGVTWEKWILVMGNDCASVVVTAEYPQAFADQLKHKLKTALLSTTWTPPSRACPPAEGPPRPRRPPADMRTQT